MSLSDATVELSELLLPTLYEASSAAVGSDTDLGFWARVDLAAAFTRAEELVPGAAGAVLTAAGKATEAQVDFLFVLLEDFLDLVDVELVAATAEGAICAEVTIAGFSAIAAPVEPALEPAAVTNRDAVFDAVAT